jgi:hypothetical protein
MVPSEFIIYTNIIIVDPHLYMVYVVTGFEVLLGIYMEVAFYMLKKYTLA